MKKLFTAAFLLALAFALTSCVSAEKKVQGDIETNLTNLKNLDEGAIDALMAEMVPTESGYKDFFSEMLKNLEYEIVAVEKKEGNEAVSVEVNLKSKEIDGLIDQYYNEIITGNIDAVLINQPVDKQSINDSALLNLLTEYKGKYLLLNDITINRVFEYKKDGANWGMQNKADFYNAVLGDFIKKVEVYKTDKLPALFIESFLGRLKSINTEHIAALSGAGQANNVQFELYAKFYNNMDYEILKTESLGEGKTKFNIRLDIIDSGKTFKDFGDKYIQYIKNSIDTKKTPTNSELETQTYKLLMESIDGNKTNKASKETTLIVNSVLDIENLTEFFKVVFDDVSLNSANTTKEISERMQNLYS
ncbi:MAG: hypothetical protein LBV08_03690 [Clostridiales bacterium]|nr:hypothetical protein [Clostridiales bacterium]